MISSLKYKLPSRLRLHPAQAITLRASTNIQGTFIQLDTKISNNTLSSGRFRG